MFVNTASRPRSRIGFLSGTTLCFIQAVAPLGWTRITTFDDAALRVVGTATPGSGGTNGFSTVMAQTATGSHVLTTSEMPSHSHGLGGASGGYSLLHSSADGTKGLVSTGSQGTDTGVTSTQSTGSGTGHTHTFTMGMKYVDSLIAQKN